MRFVKLRGFVENPTGAWDDMLIALTSIGTIANAPESYRFGLKYRKRGLYEHC